VVELRTSFKFRHSGLRYLIVVSIKHGDIVSIQGPFPCGVLILDGVWSPGADYVILILKRLVTCAAMLAREQRRTYGRSTRTTHALREVEGEERVRFFEFPLSPKNFTHRLLKRAPIPTIEEKQTQNVPRDLSYD